MLPLARPSSRPIPVPKPGLETLVREADVCVTCYALATWQCSGALRVTNPCFSKDTKAGIARPALAGPWRACAHDAAGNTPCLLTWAAAAPAADPEMPGWNKVLSITNSGLFGIFDDARYPSGSVGEYKDPRSFYGKACTATDNRQNFGLVENVGVVLRPGLGSGSHDIYERMGGEGCVDAVYIKFFNTLDSGLEDDSEVGH